MSVQMFILCSMCLVSVLFCTPVISETNRKEKNDALETLNTWIDEWQNARFYGENVYDEFILVDPSSWYNETTLVINEIHDFII